MDVNTLVRHQDIQKWVSRHHGQPAIARERDPLGGMRSRLCLRFEQARQLPSNSLDDGMSPCSWAAWLAELDRQQLALKVSAKTSTFEFVGRSELH